MSDSAKKISGPPDFDLDDIPINQKVTTATNIENKIALEKAMLESLAQTQNKDSVPNVPEEDTEIDVVPAPMKEEDLEYPDIPSSESEAPIDVALDEEFDAQLDDVELDSQLDEELNSLDDEFDAVEEVAEAEAIEMEDNSEIGESTSEGFEIPVDELEADEQEQTNESEVDHSLEEIDSILAQGGLSKREEMRLKRLKKTAEKRKARLEEERRMAEERAEQERRDRESNILSVEALMEQAKGGAEIYQGDELDADEDEFESSTQSGSSSSINLASIKSQLLGDGHKLEHERPKLIVPFEAKEAQSAGVKKANNPPELVAVAQKRPWYMALAISVLVILGEVVKSVMPAAIVWLYFQQQQKFDISQQAINHLASGEQFQIEVGLTLLKEQAKPELQEYYYKVVTKRLEQLIVQSWSMENIDHNKLWHKLSEIYNYSFVDAEKLNLPALVSASMQKEEQSLYELYENFYQAELKNLNDGALVDHLRQANIFLGQKECLKSYERFDLVFNRIPDSLAATKGKMLSFHCAFVKDRKQTREYFRHKQAITHLNKLKEIESNAAVNRAPASTKTKTKK